MNEKCAFRHRSSEGKRRRPRDEPRADTVSSVPKSQIAYLLDRISAVAEVLSASLPRDHWHDEDLSDVALETATLRRDAVEVLDDATPVYPGRSETV
jgi:hypothetical protein